VAAGVGRRNGNGNVCTRRAGSRTFYSGGAAAGAGSPITPQYTKVTA